MSLKKSYIATKKSCLPILFGGVSYGVFLCLGYAFGTWGGFYQDTSIWSHLAATALFIIGFFLLFKKKGLWLIAGMPFFFLMIRFIPASSLPEIQNHLFPAKADGLTYSFTADQSDYYQLLLSLSDKQIEALQTKQEPFFAQLRVLGGQTPINEIVLLSSGAFSKDASQANSPEIIVKSPKVFLGEVFLKKIITMKSAFKSVACLRGKLRRLCPYPVWLMVWNTL